MQIIQDMTKRISDELADAERYARMANRWKEEQPEAAKLFLDLANAEVDHQNKLHDQITKLIRRYRDKYGDPPREMLAVYNYLHDQAMDKAAEVMAHIKLFNG